METPLGKVYKELIYLKKVKNQTEFGNALGYNKGYVSTLLKQATPLKSEVRMRGSVGCKKKPRPFYRAGFL